MFQARGLSYTYPSGRIGIHNVTLEAGPGERIVVMGPNGSGKSTFLELVATAIPSQPETLSLFGESKRTATRALRRRIGVVQDQPVHIETLTGLENARLFSELYGISPGETDNTLVDLFAVLGLEEVQNIPVSEYSYGMKRKLLLVEALVHKPELLIVDEPTLGLDPPSQAALLTILENYSRNGACILIATNDMILAQHLATRIVFLCEGEMIAQGSTDDLFAKISGNTRIDIKLKEKIVADLTLDEFAITAMPGRILAESSSGMNSLPRLIEAVLNSGFNIAQIDVRETDLGDVFTYLTGLDIRDNNEWKMDA